MYSYYYNTIIAIFEKIKSTYLILIGSKINHFSF